MSQGFVTPYPIPLPTNRGGTGLISVGSAGQILQVNGSGDLEYVDATIEFPSFRASLSSNQTIATTTWTKVQFDFEDWDTNGDYDNTTNYRYTPSVAGFYLFTVQVWFAALTDTNLYTAAIRKNGAEYSAMQSAASGIAPQAIATTALVSMNGTTDYVEGFAVQTTGVNQDVLGTATTTTFDGVLVGV